MLPSTAPKRSKSRHREMLLNRLRDVISGEAIRHSVGAEIGKPSHLVTRLKALGGCMALVITGCASQAQIVSCNDISGIYLNASEASEISLSEVLLLSKLPVRAVALSSLPDGTAIDVTAGTARRTLRSASDFTCSGEGIALPAVLTTDVSFQQLGTAQELTRYVLEKRADGSLVGHRLAKRSATAFGIPFQGKELPEDDVIWKPAR